jgi:hypothetical protein
MTTLPLWSSGFHPPPKGEIKVGGASCSPLAWSGAGCSRYLGVIWRLLLAPVGAGIDTPLQIWLARGRYKGIFSHGAKRRLLFLAFQQNKRRKRK